MHYRVTSFRYLGIFLMFLCGIPLGTLHSAKPFIGSNKENQSFKKQYAPKIKDLRKETVFSGSRFQFQEWDKHYSKLGQKKVFREKSQNSFKKKVDKQITNYERLAFNESDWNDYFSRIRKEANIEVDETAQILSDRVSYTMLLQNTQQFQEMAEKMDLRALNRFQFRSNRPEGEIPVDSVEGNEGN